MSALRGVIAIVTAGTGEVVETYADFDKAGYGGFSLRDAQAIRAKDTVKRRAMAKVLWPEVAKHMHNYTLERMWDDLQSKGGWKVTTKEIGWET